MQNQLIRSYRDLDVFQLAMTLSVEIFELSKNFPTEERYSLTDQIRRSSRSVCSNIGEGWRKRRYQAAFISKLSDAETEACETEIWLEIAFRCGYITEDQNNYYQDKTDHITAQLVRMIDHPEKWSFKS